MTFMQYQMGPDLGVVLIKAILLSLCAVFLLMPGVIMLFSKLMDTTRHKNFIPDIPLVGKFAYASRHVVAPLFLIAIVAGYMISKNCPYVFGYSTVTPPLQNSVQKAEEMQETNFGSSNMVALIVPAGDYDAEKALLRIIQRFLQFIIQCDISFFHFLIYEHKHINERHLIIRQSVDHLRIIFIIDGISRINQLCRLIIQIDQLRKLSRRQLIRQMAAIHSFDIGKSHRMIHLSAQIQLPQQCFLGISR